MLGASMMVTVLGVSALLAARVQNRQLRAEADAVAALQAAQSALEVAMLRIADDATWRGDHSNDTWAGPYTLGDGQYRYKFVDEADGDLGDDPTDAVRVYGRGTVGLAERTVSIEMRSPGPEHPDNLLANPGFEQGLSPWTGQSCSIALDANAPHSGMALLHVYDRSDNEDGPRQDVTSQISEHQPYEAEAWVRVPSGSANMRIGLRVTDEDETRYFTDPYVSVGTGWTRITASFTPSWEDSLNSAAIYVETESGQTMDFEVDDVVLRPAGSPTYPMLVRPGSYGWETN